MYFETGILAILLEIIWKMVSILIFLVFGILTVVLLMVLFANFWDRSSNKKWKEENNDLGGKQ